MISQICRPDISARLLRAAALLGLFLSLFSDLIAAVPATEEFANGKPNLRWAWARDPATARWSLTERPGFLRLYAAKAADMRTAGSSLTQEIQGPACHAQVKLDLSKLRSDDVAGFGLLAKTSACVAVRVDGEGTKVLGTQVFKERAGHFEFYPEKKLTSDVVYLRIDFDVEHNVGRTSYSFDGLDWTKIGGPFELSTGENSAGGASRLAIFCSNPRADDSRGYVDVDSCTFGTAAPYATLVRERPRINSAHTTFVADNGQLLRGPYQSTEWSNPPPREELVAIKKMGFNALHLYGEAFNAKYPDGGGATPGYATAKIDEVVAMTRELGLYLVLTIGNGANNGKYNRQWVLDFWKHYAPRYANEHHVLYEIQNEPVAWGPAYSSPNANPPGAMDMEAAAYKLIRQKAPDTPVLLFSYSVIGGEGGGDRAVDDIKAFNAEIGGDPSRIWENAAVAIHGYAGQENTPKAIARIVRAGFPCFMTEFIARTWGGDDGQAIELTADLERTGISWLNFLTVPPDGVSPLVTIPERFTQRVERTGLSWSPDFGQWPLARGPYADDGLPWPTPDTRTGGVLDGTLRIELENYDIGGPELAYHDTTPHSVRSGDYRPDEDVDLRAIVDGAPGYAVTETGGGEWLEYTVSVREPGLYRLGLRYAAPGAGSSVRMLLAGREFLSETDLERTGSLNAWKTYTTLVFLEYGRRILRVEIPKGGCDLNWLELTPVTEGPLPSGDYQIVNRLTGRALINNADADRVDLGSLTDSPATIWKLTHLGAGQYRVVSSENNRLWKSAIGSGKPVNLVGWGHGNPGSDQRFVLRPVGGGFLRIEPVASGLDFSDEGGADGSPVLQQIYRGEQSRQWAICPAGAMPFPTEVMVTRISEKDVRVSWKPVPGATGYRVKRAEASGGPYRATPNPQRQTIFNDPSARAGRDNFYVVSAVGQKEESLDSAEVKPATLVTHLKFDQPPRGTIFDDASGKDRAATAVGSVTREPGRIGSAVVLDGRDAHLTLPDGVVSELGDFTIAAWVRVDEPRVWARLFDFGNGANSYMNLVPTSGSGSSVRFAIKTEAGQQVINGAKPVPLGEWTHLAVVVEKSVGILYLNGEEIGRNGSLTHAPRALGKTTRNYIGRSLFPDPLLKGAVDDFRIYDSGLSVIEIRALAGR
jgi:endoglucanase